MKTSLEKVRASLLLAAGIASFACGGGGQNLQGNAPAAADGPPAAGAPAAGPAGGPGQPAPGGGQQAPRLQIDDLQKTAEGWPAALNKMQRDLEQIDAFHSANQVPPLLKLEAWKRFLQVYQEDVTFSHEDDRLRQIAVGRIEAIESETRFVDFNDGTVLDTHRKLMWTKTGRKVSLRHANEHCRNMTFGLGRHQDWRLPNLDELTDLYDSTSPDKVKILGGITISSYRGGVWSSKSANGCRERANTCPAFLFEDGRQEQYQYEGEVLCVREQAWPVDLGKFVEEEKAK